VTVFQSIAIFSSFYPDSFVPVYFARLAKLPQAASLCPACPAGCLWPQTTGPSPIVLSKATVPGWLVGWWLEGFVGPKIIILNGVKAPKMISRPKKIGTVIPEGAAVPSLDKWWCQISVIASRAARLRLIFAEPLKSEQRFSYLNLTTDYQELRSQTSGKLLQKLLIQVFLVRFFLHF